MAKPLASSAGWIKFLGVLLIIMGVLNILSVAGIIFGVLSLIMGLMLTKGAGFIREAAKTGDPRAMKDGLTKIGSYFKMSGILVLIMLLAYLAIIPAVAIPALIASRSAAKGMQQMQMDQGMQQMGDTLVPPGGTDLGGGSDSFAPPPPPGGDTGPTIDDSAFDAGPGPDDFAPPADPADSLDF